ncbi:hypothetical protein B9Z55_022722 [Caenorhabditis nigoni]|nr:hypothetical protein B9Z55_022722 [Caenorhabditis nigoni]
MFSGGFDGNRSNHVQACTKNSNYFQPNHHHNQSQENGNRGRVISNTFHNSKYFGEDVRQPPRFGHGWNQEKGIRSESTASEEGMSRSSNGSRRSKSKNPDRSRPREFGRGWSNEKCEENDGGIGNRTYHSNSMKDARRRYASESGQSISEDVVGVQQFNKENRSLGNGSYQEVHHIGRHESRQQRTNYYHKLESNRARAKSELFYIKSTGRDSQNKYHEYHQENFNAVATSYYCNERDIRRSANKSFNVQPVTMTRGSSECDSRRSYSKNVSYGWNEEASYKARLDSLEYHHKKWRSVSRHSYAEDNYRKENRPNSHQMGNHYGHQGMIADVRGTSNINSHASNGSSYHLHGYNNTQYNAPNANKSFHSIQTYDSHKYSSAAYCIDSNFTRSGMCRRGSWNHQSRGSQDKDQHHASSYRSGSYKGPNTSESFNRQNADNYCARQSIDVFHQSALDKNSDSNRVHESELDDDVFEQVAATDAESIAQENQSDGQNQTVDNFACAAPESADTKSHIKFNRTFGGYDAQFETSFSTMQLGNLATMTDHSPVVELTETPMEKVEPKRSTHYEVPMSKNVYKFGGDVYEITSEIGFLFDSTDIKADWRKPMQYQHDFRADGSSDEAVRWLARLRDLSESHVNLYAESSKELKNTRFNAKKIRRDSEPYNLRHMVHETSTDVWNAGNPPRRNAETIAADPTWNHATRLPKATFPDSPEPLKFAGKYFVHEGVVAKMPFLHIQSGTVSFKSANGKAVPMPPHFQCDLIPTRTHPVGFIPAGIYQYVAKSDPVYNAFKSSNCIKNMQRVNNNKPGKMCYATEDVFDSFMEDIRADWGSGMRVTRVAPVTHQANI